MTEINLATFDTRTLIPKGKAVQVSKLTGIDSRGLYKWREGSSPKIHNFVAVANALGYEVIMRKKQ